jgi:hypothetical protein
VQPHREAQPQDEAARGLRDRELRAHFLGHGQVPLAAEVERFQVDRDRLAVLVARTQAEPTERKARHPGQGSAVKQV